MAILIVLSASLLGRLVVNCSGVTALGSVGEKRTGERKGPHQHEGLIHLGWANMGYIPDLSYINYTAPSLTSNKLTFSQRHLLQKPNWEPSNWVLTLPDLHDDLHGACEAHTSLPVFQSLQAPIGCSCSKMPVTSGGESGLFTLPRNPSAALGQNCEVESSKEPPPTCDSFNFFPFHRDRIASPAPPQGYCS